MRTQIIYVNQWVKFHMAKIKEKHHVRDSEVQGRLRDERMNTETITVLEKTPLHLQQML